jgi:CheY-like chemotaxis protein
VESEEGAGSVFTVLLPPAAPRRPSTAPVLPVVPEVRRGRVLLVDDEPHFASSLCKILQRRHDAEAVGSAGEALARITAGATYDAVLCDLMMPGMSGMELHATLAQRAPEQASRMIFLTGGAFTAQARAFLDAVPNARLEKPVDPPAVEALVASLVLRGPLVPSSAG